MAALFGGIGGFFAFSAFILLLFVCVSTPVWDKVYFLSTSVPQGSLRFGIWGACILGDNTKTCTGRALGYNVESIIAAAGGDTGGTATNAIIHGLTYALVLIPIAAGFAFIAFLFALVPSILTHILGSLIAFLAFCVAIVAFGFELGIFVTAKHRFEDDGLSSSYGNAIWLSLAAVICLLLAFFLVCCTGLQERRQRRYSNAIADPAYTNGAGYADGSVPNEKRGLFWNRRQTAVV